MTERRFAWPSNERSFYLGLTDVNRTPRMMAQGSLMGLGVGNPQAVDDADQPEQAWRHYAATWDGTTLTLYRAGLAVGTQPAVGTLFGASQHETLIGKSRHGTPNYLHFVIDELAIWDHALSAAQVSAVHARGAAGEPLTGG